MDLKNNLTIKILKNSDWKEWKNIRLEALKNHPTVFRDSYNDEKLWSEKKFKDYLDEKEIFGGYLNNEIVGYIGFSSFKSEKMRHRGKFFSVYVKPENRKFGIGDKLMTFLLKQAKKKVLQLECIVTSNNVPATNLYKKYGFIKYGVHPRAMKVLNKFYDKDLMYLKFD